MSEKTIVEKIIDEFTQNGFEIKSSEDRLQNYLLNGDEEIKIIEQNEQGITLHLVRKDKEGNFSYQKGFELFIFEKDLDISNFIYVKESGCYLSQSWQFRRVNNIDERTTKLILRKKFKSKRQSKRNKSLTISPDQYGAIIAELWQADRKSKSYRNSYRNYLLNDLTESFSSKKIKDTTSLQKGEYNFLTHRLNLKTKNKRSDFLKYLNNDDINALQDLTIKLINQNVFSRDFLLKLNNFFKKENLKDIIEMGRLILSLGKTDMTTLKAEKVIKRVTNKKVSALEALWQEFFEKYLLFLIFSYKSIHPKVELKNIEGEKRYPDFIGVNHYNGLDVIEIKTHLKHALTFDRSHQNYSFSSELSKAIIQTTNYMDQISANNFKKGRDRSKITSTIHEENLHRPRGIIIISSYRHLANKINKSSEPHAFKDFTKLRNSLHNIEILTFDEILNTADEYLKNVT